MATLYISEYETLAGGANRANILPLMPEPPLTEQTVAIGVSSAQSNAFTAKTYLLRIHCDAVCSILVGPNPTAAAANKRLAANQTEYFGVNPGDKIAVITNS